MQIPGNKKVVSITGSVWTHKRNAPRHMLIDDGFLRPTWFTTRRALTDADYRRISTAEFHAACAANQVLAHLEYYSSFIGVLEKDFEATMAAAGQGVLIVGPPEIAAQLVVKIPQAIVFSFKDPQMELSEHLDSANRAGQVHRIDIDVLEPGAWAEVYVRMMEIIGLPPRVNTL